MTFLKLLKLFKSEYQIYQTSKNKSLFYNILLKNEVFIKYQLFNDITNDCIKSKSEQIYQSLKFNFIDIIHLNSKNYPKNLFNLYNPPFVILKNINSDISILNSQKFVYLSGIAKLTDYGRLLLNDVLGNIKNKNIQILFNYICVNKYVYKKYKDIFNIDFKYIDLLNESNDFKYVFDDKIYYIYLNKFYNEYIDELKIALSECLVVIESGYDLSILKNIDIALEQGKDILTFPANIYDKNFSLNNWLIKQGAICINDARKYEIFSFL